MQRRCCGCVAGAGARLIVEDYGGREPVTAARGVEGDWLCVRLGDCGDAFHIKGTGLVCTARSEFTDAQCSDTYPHTDTALEMTQRTRVEHPQRCEPFRYWQQSLGYMPAESVITMVYTEDVEHAYLYTWPRIHHRVIKVTSDARFYVEDGGGRSMDGKTPPRCLSRQGERP